MTSWWLWGASLIPAVLTSACGGGGASGTRPHDMNAAAHESAAQEEDRKAEQLASRHDAGRPSPAAKCHPGQRGAACWTSRGNPTEKYQKLSTQARELAARHRAASAALRDAEAQVCAGISDEDRDLSPFANRKDIRSVGDLTETEGGGEGTFVERVAGLQVVFRATPGLSAEWLQRVVDCHLARNAVIGHEAAAHEMDYCPLTLRGVAARVSSTGDGFAISIRSNDQKVVEELRRRGRALLAGEAALRP